MAGKNVDHQLPFYSHKTYSIKTLMSKEWKRGNSPERYNMVSFTNIWLTCVIYVYMCAVVTGEEEGDSSPMLLLL